MRTFSALCAGSTQFPCHTLHPVLIRIYIENVWQCMNCFTLRLTIELACGMCVSSMLYTYTLLCVCICVLVFVCVMCVRPIVVIRQVPW